MTEPNYQPKGWVYILTNPIFPEYIKIGLTTLDPSIRAKQLSAGTGIPAPYKVSWKLYITDCGIVERLAHNKLDAFRERSNREFFRMPVDQAISVITEIAGNYQAAQPFTEALIEGEHPN